ncbi:MAG: condensation domain-containing protein, partial [Segetibacter sp.]
NKQQQLCPAMVAGEICIAGDGLARGYLNRAELTAEKFIPHPFDKTAGSRLYKTGDLGRWLADGNIEYLGRIDEQVKIRGYRIELGEIETVLMQSGLVKQAVIAAKQDANGNKRLIGYVVADGESDKQAITNHLHSKLPDYMVPALWIQLQTLPLTANGKIDRKAMPDPDANDLTGEYVAPRNKLESELAAIWQKLLGIEKVGIEDNFFELGGDSILTIQIVARVNQSGYQLQPKDIFLNQTISRLSAVIASRLAADVTGEQGILTGLSGLLPIQQWYLTGEQNNLSHFNQCVLLGIDKTVKEEELRLTVNQLVQHHDALRFRYYQKDGNWLQEYGAGGDAVVAEDLQSKSNEILASAITECANKYQRSLDIERGDLIRVVLMKTPESEPTNRLLIVIHHLAVDGVSWRILLQHLEMLLADLRNSERLKLGFKSFSYRQWYNALESYSKSPKLLSQTSYWQKALSHLPQLPVDFTSHDRIQVKDLLTHVVSLNAERTTELLQQVPKAYNTEIDDILIASLAVTIANWSNSSR